MSLPSIPFAPGLLGALPAASASGLTSLTMPLPMFAQLLHQAPRTFRKMRCPPARSCPSSPWGSAYLLAPPPKTRLLPAPSTQYDLPSSMSLLPPSNEPPPGESTYKTTPAPKRRFCRSPPSGNYSCLGATAQVEEPRAPSSSRIRPARVRALVPSRHGWRIPYHVSLVYPRLTLYSSMYQFTKLA